MSRVRVCCRVRPTFEADSEECIAVAGKDEARGVANDVSVLISGGATFQIDAAFGQQATQEELFDGVARPLVDEAFRGINCTLFSYGQTGSGKTHTLQGKPGPLRGILPRAVEAIFQQMASLEAECGQEDAVGGSGSEGGTSCELHVSVMEIYKERLRDLLVSVGPASLTSSWGQGAASSSANLRIRQHADGSVWVEGLTETLVGAEVQFSDLLSGALKKRATGSHAMNSESSRSHLVTILSLRLYKRASGQRVSSKIHLIDLAGSEMVRKTDATGNALKEAQHINKSLSALGNVIYALTSPAGGGNDGAGAAREKKAHVPFRDSKLTRLLQDSLGGNAKTVLLLAVASARVHMQESINTLRFGERARQVCTHPRINSELDEDRVRGALQRAETQILLLTQTITEMQRQRPGGESAQPQLCYKCASMDVRDEPEPAEQAPTPAPASALAPIPAPAVVNAPAEPSQPSKSAKASAAPASGKTTSSLKQLQQQMPKRGGTGKQKSVSAVTAAAPSSSSGNPAKKLPASVPLVSLPALPHPEQRISPRAPASRPSSPPPLAAESSLPIGPADAVPGGDQPVYVGEADASGPRDGEDVTADERLLLDSIRRAAANAGSDDEDDDQCGRCAVCGLDEEGSAQLQDQTGEVLGALFMCDGNCGGTFHARCVNLIGEGGQFQVPEGEWYCSSCTVEEGSSGVASAPTQATLDYLKAEYHAMRRERNRVLTQWQQERSIASIIDARHRTTYQQRDKDLAMSSERVVTLEAQLAAERQEAQRLRAVSEELLAALQSASSSRPQSPRRGVALAPLNLDCPGAAAISSWQQMMQTESSILQRKKKGGPDEAGEVVPAEPSSASSSSKQRRAKKPDGAERGREGLELAQMLDTAAPPLCLDSGSPVSIPLRGAVPGLVSTSLSSLSSLSPRGCPPNNHDDESRHWRDSLESSLGLDGLDALGEGVAGLSSSSSSKIKSRLKELLRAVQEEAVSFNQITKRHKEREVHRERGLNRGVTIGNG